MNQPCGSIRLRFHGLCLLACLAASIVPLSGRVHEIQPAVAGSEEEFETIANALQPGDELVLHGGTYSQTARRAVTAKGTAERPIVIRAANGERPRITRPPGDRRQNVIEFVDCAHLIVRGLQFEGGSSGVRFIRGEHVTLEDCEIFGTGNNALTMNSGNCHAFVLRRNHIHHTGLSEAGETEGEGMYIGCHDGSCRTSDSLIEGNYIHHLRATSNGGNDGIEIKAGSFGNVVRHNVIHDANMGRRYPGIFVYGGGPGTNLVEGNAIWNAGEGIQVVADAVIRNNLVFACSGIGITAAPHAAMARVRNVIVVNNTIHNAPVGVRVRWAEATNVVLANNAIYCADGLAVDARLGGAVVRSNLVSGRLNIAAWAPGGFIAGGSAFEAFVDVGRWDFRPRAASELVGRADTGWAPPLDFNGTKRPAPGTVGAYEFDPAEENPGWTVQPGFKQWNSSRK